MYVGSVDHLAALIEREPARGMWLHGRLSCVAIDNSVGFVSRKSEMHHFTVDKGRASGALPSLVTSKTAEQIAKKTSQIVPLQFMLFTLFAFL